MNESHENQDLNQNQDPNPYPNQDRWEDVSEQAFDLARSWLEVGTEVAGAALEAVAKGLRATADGMGRLGEALENTSDDKK